MKIPTYKDGVFVGMQDLDPEMASAASRLANYMAIKNITALGGVTLPGDLPSQLAQSKLQIAYLKSVVQSQNDVNLRQASEILGNRKDAADLQRQLAEVTRERDTLKAMVDLHDAMNDRRRAQANETPFKRRTYENG